MYLASFLESGRRDFLDAVRGATPRSALERPRRGGWSVVECAEHVIAVENRYLGWIEEGTEIFTGRDPDRELRLFNMVRDRSTRLEAPDPVRPSGRFASLEAAVGEFQTVRNRSVQLARKQGESLYSVGVKHPYFGDLNAVEVIQLIDAHARRHAEQIREICESV